MVGAFEEAKAVLLFPGPARPRRADAPVAGRAGTQFPRKNCVSALSFPGLTQPRTPWFTFSHLNALRAAMRIEAYGLYAQKGTEKAPAPFGLDPGFVQSDSC